MQGGKARQLTASLVTAPFCPEARATGSVTLSDGDRLLAPVLEVLRPRLDRARQCVEQTAASLASRRPPTPLDPATVGELVLADAERGLVGMLSRAAVLELHFARMRGALCGRTPEHRFIEFLAALAEREAAGAFLSRYPVLDRLAARCIGDAVDAGIEFLTRLCSDWPQLANALQLDLRSGPLVSMHSAGDGHRRGRSVIIATFASGARLVYKPRSLAVDVHYQQLLEWVSTAAGPEFRLLKLIDRGPYGWSEYVAEAPWRSEREARRLYERQGIHLALLYALGASDMHRENVIVAGEQPVLVDVETLFGPQIGAPAALSTDALLTNASLLSSGFMPLDVPVDEAPDGLLDCGGLRAAVAMPTAVWARSWECAGTDEMRLVRSGPTVVAGKGLCAPPAPDAADQMESVLAGFERTYQLLERHRALLLAEDGPIARFAADDVRIIVRLTRTYATLLENGLHPDVLCDHRARRALFARLEQTVRRRPELREVVAAECADTERGEIPHFTTKPGSRDIWTSDGRRLRAVLDASGLDVAAGRLESFGEADAARQMWLIRAAFAARAANRGAAGAPIGDLPLAVAAVPSAERLIAMAVAVGDRIAELAWPTAHGVGWFGLRWSGSRARPQGVWAPAPLGLDLYGGATGVALFLAYLGAITGASRFTTLAQGAVDAIRADWRHHLRSTTDIGAFTGLSGIVYGLAHAATLWGREDLLRDAHEVVERIRLLVGGDETLDFLSGAAGCILALRALHRSRASSAAMDTMLECGERLQQTAQAHATGVAWPHRGSGGACLAGLSHGVAGIAHALIELSSMCGHESFHTTALRALDYEDSLFCRDAGNWLDLRPADRAEAPARRFATTWCHGAPGIALARLASMHQLGPARGGRHLDAAVKTTLRSAADRPHSACDGAMGRIETLLAAAEHDGARWRPALARAVSRVVADLDVQGPRCDHPGGVDSPELMTGLAGIGLGLLRLAAPAQVPSILRLAAPNSTARPT